MSSRRFKSSVSETCPCFLYLQGGWRAYAVNYNQIARLKGYSRSLGEIALAAPRRRSLLYAHQSHKRVCFGSGRELRAIRSSGKVVIKNQSVP